MSFSAPIKQSFDDILNSIAMIEDFTRNMDFEAFRSSPIAIAVVERKLQIISEAAIRLGDHAENYCPGPPWREIRGIGNHLRHAYERIALDTLWGTVTDDLPPLKSSVTRAVAHLR